MIRKLRIEWYIIRRGWYKWFTPDDYIEFGQTGTQWKLRQSVVVPMSETVSSVTLYLANGTQRTLTLQPDEFTFVRSPIRYPLARTVLLRLRLIAGG
jgi:hypothetical protein